MTEVCEPLTFRDLAPGATGAACAGRASAFCTENSDVATVQGTHCRRIAFGNWLTRGLSLARFGRDRFYPLAFETPTGRPPWISLSRAGRVLRTREPETPRCMISTSF